MLVVVSQLTLSMLVVVSQLSKKKNIQLKLRVGIK